MPSVNSSSVRLPLRVYVLQHSSLHVAASEWLNPRENRVGVKWALGCFSALRRVRGAERLHATYSLVLHSTSVKNGSLKLEGCVWPKQRCDDACVVTDRSNFGDGSMHTQHAHQMREQKHTRPLAASGILAFSASSFLQCLGVPQPRRCGDIYPRAKTTLNSK